MDFRGLSWTFTFLLFVGFLVVTCAQKLPRTGSLDILHLGIRTDHIWSLVGEDVWASLGTSDNFLSDCH